MPFVLRRTKAQVLADLPPKVLQDVLCDLAPLQARLYETFAAASDVGRLAEGKDAALGAAGGRDSKTSGGGRGSEAGSARESEGGEGGRRGPHVFQSLHYLRRLCSHPLLVLDEGVPEHVKVRRAPGVNVTGHALMWVPLAASRLP